MRLAVASDDLAIARERMVQDQLEARGIRDARVLDAMRTVPRHEFVGAERRARAYADDALAIGHRQSISQPYVVALMSELAAIVATSRVLEVGTGSGYQTAVLAELAAEVYTIELVEPLGRAAESTLRRLGYDRVHVRVGDATNGWPEAAPFDAIIVTAAPRRVPPALVAQLGTDGRLVAPVGRFLQRLEVHRRTSRGITIERSIGVRFVPMKSLPGA